MNKEILRLAVPNIISNISIPLLSSVDTLLMGHLSSVELGAVGISSMIFNFVYWNFGFLRMGTTGMTAQAFGRKNDFEMASMLQKSWVVSLIISSIIMVLMIPICRAASFLMNVSDSQQEFVNIYFYTRIWAAPATLGLYALLGWFFGMQNAKWPLIITISINLINILLSYYFVMVLGYGIRGVALGTVIAQYFGFFLAFVIIAKKYRKFVVKIPLKILIAWENIREFLRINRDIFFRTVCLSFAFAFLYSQASLKGELYLAANVVLLQFLNWMSYAIDGFAFASESLVGKYHGAKDSKNTYKSIRYIFAWGLVLAIGFTIVYWIFGGALVQLFTNQADVVTEANSLIYWVIVMPIVAFSCYIWDGIYVGLTASVAMRNTMLISVIIYLLTFYGGSYFFNYTNVWLALLVFLFARGLVQTIVFLKRGLSIH